ncbi:hypothetical protein L0P88_16335 [Muricauda sp. SCSIO 64092]|uniref:hypothetical protein n=1 Tax=Allomuricauda sp. SCSIO 64092 TaxID=2908842 RepID=UPI001FF5C927|nr:hypothetical protein [Muricauda sp. SCSIO 64092]UOY05510.1 hypothetical protein L0P88_16335 [Muricauda sp. SCSIO 64092]
MNKEEKSKKGKVIGAIVGTIAFALSYYGVQQLFKKDLESELKNAALELNKQTPMQIDQFSRLDSASTKGKTNFIYHYTLFDLEKSEVNLDTVNKYIRPNLIENIKNSPELKVYRDNNITMDYEYYDKNGAFVTKISVTPELYK